MPPLCKGAAVFFEFYRDEEGRRTARIARRTEPRDLDEMQKLYVEAEEAQKGAGAQRDGWFL